jgi:multidrug efflux pump subunit AcrB
VFGIFAVLVLQFRSFRQPLIIFISLPFALTGALLSLYLSGNSLSFMAAIGLTSLAGIVVNNAIILVDFANRLIERGMALKEAVMEAACTRARPILITTLTTVGSLLPMTLAGSPMYAPMGWVIIGGLLVSTALTLLLVPVLYVLFGSGRRSSDVAVTMSTAGA